MNYLKLLFIYCALCLFMGCSKSGTATAPPPPGGGGTTDTTSNLRVLTYNIHHANPPAMPVVIDIAAIANVINQQTPHLVAIQEVDVNNTRSGITLNQSAELGRLTGMSSFFAKTINYAGGEYGVAILSKFPMSNTSNNPLPTAIGTGGESRVLATATITLGNGKKLVFACTHLDAQANDTNRLLQINKIVEILSPVLLPVIVAGDFNAVPGTRIINILDANFTRTCVSSCGFTSPAIAPTKTIDFIAYATADKFTLMEHRVINERNASDHLPVFSVLRIK